MIGQSLADLDELVLRCRDDRARSYIAEAVACYKAGAFRASIVATWIAVVFDLLAKLRELDLAASRAAKKELETFERYRANRNYSALLDFERRILDTAKDDFELLSSEEFDDLARLRDDRNRCAHPSLQSTDEPYAPVAELARYHLRNAVVHVLAQPPVQGKFALDRIWREIHSEYFPTNVEEAVEALTAGPLARARTSLIRSVVIGLTKDLLLEERDGPERRRQYAALRAVLQMHRAASEAVLRSDLPRIFERLEDQDIGQAVVFVHYVPFGWEALTGANRTKLRQYVTDCPGGAATTVVPHALQIPALVDAARTRLEDLPDDALARSLGEGSIPEVVELAVRRFTNARSYREARTRGASLLLPAATKLTTAQVQDILSAFVSNRQIKEAIGMVGVLGQLLEQTQPLTQETRQEWAAVRDVLVDDQFFTDDDEVRDLIEQIEQKVLSAPSFEDL